MTRTDAEMREAVHRGIVPAKIDEVRGGGPAPALLVEHLCTAVLAVSDNLLGIRDRSIAGWNSQLSIPIPRSLSRSYEGNNGKED
ncbi:hypothetical protein [Streptomyces sp. SID12501]|uniref:hypothetical protein n=1 Tax=Streptomyces sp. SID12501 TaxID=2706042 RepID=UPI001EF262DE|nr:hypothetical protein [Streptomyces sp. SID12501]